MNAHLRRLFHKNDRLNTFDIIRPHIGNLSQPKVSSNYYLAKFSNEYLNFHNSSEVEPITREIKIFPE